MPVNLYRLIDPPAGTTVVVGRIPVSDFAGRPRFSQPDTPTPVANEGGWIVTHPRYRAFLERVGVTTGEVMRTRCRARSSAATPTGMSVRVVLKAGSRVAQSLLPEARAHRSAGCARS